MDELFRAEVTPVSVTQTKTGRYIFRGVASTIGNVDRMRRVFLPGAFGITKLKVPLLANHDEHSVLGSSTLTPQGDKLIHESSINPKAGKADEMISLLEEGDIASTSISWLSNQRFYGWNDLKRQNPELAKSAAALGVAQLEDAVYFGTAEIVENSVVPIPANDRALIALSSLVGTAERGFLDSMREVAALGPPVLERAAGARHSQRDMASIQTAHDALVNLGATCTVEPQGGSAIDDGDDAQDRKDYTTPAPLGGWVDYMNPKGALEGADTADITTDDSNQNPMPLPAELEDLDRELAALADRLTV